MKCYAYTDESGNSGLKLFGDAQDTFWTGTMISFSDPLSMISDISPISSFDCALDVRSSDASFGLQLIDVCMWLSKRVIEKHDKPRGQCAVLWQCLLERSYIKDYDFDMLIREVKAGADMLAGREYTEEQLSDAKRTLGEIESNRRNRLLERESGTEL